MLFTFLFTPITYVLSLIFGAFPVLAIPANVTTSLSSAVASLYSLTSFIPVNTLATVVSIYIGIEIAILYFKFMQFVIGYIPFIGH